MLIRGGFPEISQPDERMFDITAIDYGQRAKEKRRQADLPVQT